MLMMCPSSKYYYNDYLRSCLGKAYSACSDNCLECSGSSDNCVSCPEGYHLEVSRVVGITSYYVCIQSSDCPEGTYELTTSDVSPRLCVACHTKCALTTTDLTCFGPSEFHCTSCSVGEYNQQKNSCKGVYLTPYSGGPVELPIPQEALDSAYTLSIFFKVATFAAGDVLQLGSFKFTTDDSGYFSTLYYGELSLHTPVALTNSWVHLSFSMDTFSRSQLTLAKKLIPFDLNQIGSYQSPNPFILGADNPCKCYFANASLLRGAIRANEFTSGLAFSTLSYNSPGYPAFVIYRLAESKGTTLTDDRGLAVEISSENYWQTESDPNICRYDSFEYLLGDTCKSCLIASNSGYCYNKYSTAFCTPSSNLLLQKAGICQRACAFDETQQDDICEMTKYSTFQTVLSSDFKNDATLLFIPSSTPSTFTIEFWRRQIKVSSLSVGVISFGNFYIDTACMLYYPLSEEGMGGECQQNTLFEYVIIRYDLSNIYLQSDSYTGTNTLENYTSLLTKVEIFFGKSVFSLRELKIWSGSKDITELSFLKGMKLNKSSLPSTLLVYFPLDDSDLDSVKEYVSGKSVELSTYGGVPETAKAQIQVGNSGYLCEDFEAFGISSCEKCPEACVKGCSNDSCLDCNKSYIKQEQSCTGSYMWNSKNAASKATTQTKEVSGSWSFDFFFKVIGTISPNDEFVVFNSSTDIRLAIRSQDASTLACYLNYKVKETHVPTISQWSHFALVSKSTEDNTRCVFNSKTSSVFTKLASSVVWSLMPTTTQMYIGQIRFFSEYIDPADFELVKLA